MQKKVDIHKAAGVLIKDRKFLVTRTKGKDFFIAPGGKVESDEIVAKALERELEEELCISIDEADLEEFGTFFAPAAGDQNKLLKMEVFIVAKWSGELEPSAEVEEIMWIDSVSGDSIELGSVFKHEVLPRLKERNLID